MVLKSDPKNIARYLPDRLAEVALIDAKTCAAVGAMSISWWHEEVRTGRAPKPSIRRPRCTRWLMSEVHAFWVGYTRQEDLPDAQVLCQTVVPDGSRGQS
jgi:hypothetical protein